MKAWVESTECDGGRPSGYESGSSKQDDLRGRTIREAAIPLALNLGVTVATGSPHVVLERIVDAGLDIPQGY